MSLHLHLCDRNTPLCDAWEREFSSCPLVTVHLADFFSVEADILVSGGNSHGFMTAGLELAIALKLGDQVQPRLQRRLRGEFGGLLPVGQAIALATDDPRWPLLIHAPTSLVPMDVSSTLNPYLAARAALRLWREMDGKGARVWHMLMPGLGTGLGRVAPRVCAMQMRRAYDEVVLGRQVLPLTVEAAQKEYWHLLGPVAEDEEASAASAER